MLSTEQQDTLLRVTAYNISARYPDDIEKARKRYTREFVVRELGTVEDMGQWLKSLLI